MFNLITELIVLLHTFDSKTLLRMFLFGIPNFTNILGKKKKKAVKALSPAIVKLYYVHIWNKQITQKKLGKCFSKKY